MEKVLLSTVTPVYQGIDYLAELSAELDAVRTQLSRSDAPLQLIESIFVDDGSIDGSHALLTDLAARYSWLKIITLSRNFGQHPATVAGILYTCGDWVATLDEDLQHHPKHIVPLLLHGINHGSDIVYAQPKGAVHQSYLRDTASRTYKKMLAILSGNPRVVHFNSFRIIRGSIARAAASVSGHDTYLDMAIGWFTKRTATMNLDLVDRRFTRERKSGYTFMMLLQHRCADGHPP